MFVLFLVLSSIMICEAVATFFKVRRFRDYYVRRISKPPLLPEPLPKVAMLAPCKGVDADLSQNIASWQAQDYKDFHIFFIVESEDDPAYDVIRSMGGNVLIAGKAQDSGQKVHNLSFAIGHLPEEFEVFAFVDSDCHLEPDWLKRLVSQILRNPENAATGYRWFTDQNNFGSVLRAVWNSSVLTLNEEDGKHNFAWGGSMAITRSTFQLCKVREYWQGSISDDYGLTTAIQSCGKRVDFVPGVIGWTSGSTSVTDFFRWAFRQILITRIYNPRLWSLAIVFHALWLCWIFSGVLFPLSFIPAFFFVQFIQACKADFRWQCIRAGNRLFFWLSGPFIGLCNSLLLIATLFTRTVIWRGLKYELHDKRKLTILDV
jgi:ceramide glucosyltransferase